MKNRKLVAVLILSVNLIACSEPPPAPEAAAKTATTESAAPTDISKVNQGILTDTQREGLNAANQVSNLLKDGEAERRKKLAELEK